MDLHSDPISVSSYIFMISFLPSIILKLLRGFCTLSGQRTCSNLRPKYNLEPLSFIAQHPSPFSTGYIVVLSRRVNELQTFLPDPSYTVYTRFCENSGNVKTLPEVNS